MNMSGNKSSSIQVGITHSFLSLSAVSLPNSKIILQGTVERKRCRGQQRESGSDNVNEYTNHNLCALMRIYENRDRWTSLTTTTTQRHHNNLESIEDDICDVYSYYISNIRSKCLVFFRLICNKSEIETISCK